MVNFQSPELVSEDLWVAVKVWHAFDGLFLWEFFTTLDYEWNIIRGRRPFRWTIWIYSLTRIATLVAVILNIVGVDISRPINCQLWVIFQSIFAYLAFSGASLLIVLRIFVLWNKNKIPLVLATSVWGTNIAFFIRGIVKLRSAWETAQTNCEILNTESTKASVLVTLVTNIILFLIMFAGLLHLRRQGGNMPGLWRTLWRQGIIWFFLAIVAGIPPMVFIFLDLNDAFNLMFQMPSLIIMSIAATQMYRFLTDFYSSELSDSSRHSGRVSSDVKRVSAGPIPLNRMQVAVHTAHEQYPASQTSHIGSCVSMGEQLRVKPRGLGSEDDLEGGLEKISAADFDEVPHAI